MGETEIGIESNSTQICHQIEDTRAALSEKLDTLEYEVRETVEHAKNSVQEVVEEVKHTFDVRHQVERHPVVCCTVALGVGFVAGRLLFAKSSQFKADDKAPLNPEPSISSPQSQISTRDVLEQSQNIVRKVASNFGDEFQSLKNLAITSAFQILGQFAKKSLPEFISSELVLFPTR